jgi:hypothetical protein
MTAPQAEPTVLASDLTDICHVRLDEDAGISLSDFSRIMRGISTVEVPVSAFNSSI